MSGASSLRVVILKPSKYGVTGQVERFRRGFMPNSTITHMASMTPERVGDCAIETVTVDEYVQTDLGYLDLLRGNGSPVLLALVGVQSHQFRRSLDLAAYARAHGVEHAIIGGPHAMTCETSALQGRGVSFAVSEAEVIWERILEDAVNGALEPVYGGEGRWQPELTAPVLTPPSSRDLRRYIVGMAGVYPARGCPFTCNFCSVIKIAGRRIRSQDIDTTMASIRALAGAGVRLIMFTSDNFNKYAEADELLDRLIEARLPVRIFVQCDTQVASDEAFIERLHRAGCFQMFVGVESFDRAALLGAHKAQNHPETYGEIVRLCRKHNIATHFSNIIGFPGQTADGVREHGRVLRELDPDIASFYILTPIPGTEQYDDFLSAGRISEHNLDRYDGTNVTWTHDRMARAEIEDLLFESYRAFYPFSKVLHSTLEGIRRPASVTSWAANIGLVPFSRYCARQRVHPMSGGVGRVVVDHESDYLPFRRRRYDLERVPLPRSLRLSASDETLNRRVNVAV